MKAIITDEIKINEIKQFEKIFKSFNMIKLKSY